jgi:hypothetical protein
VLRLLERAATWLNTVKCLAGDIDRPRIQRPEAAQECTFCKPRAHPVIDGKGGCESGALMTISFPSQTGEISSRAALAVERFVAQTHRGCLTVLGKSAG